MKLTELLIFLPPVSEQLSRPKDNFCCFTIILWHEIKSWTEGELMDQLYQISDNFRLFVASFITQYNVLANTICGENYIRGISSSKMNYKENLKIIKNRKY